MLARNFVYYFYFLLFFFDFNYLIVTNSQVHVVSGSVLHSSAPTAHKDDDHTKHKVGCGHVPPTQNQVG